MAWTHLLFLIDHNELLLKLIRNVAVSMVRMDYRLTAQ